MKYKDLWLEFVEEYFCGLCGNQGYIPERIIKTPAGKILHCQKKECICPNGREIKKVNDKGGLK